LRQEVRFAPRAASGTAPDALSPWRIFP
jgi:hypothetical protein